MKNDTVVEPFARGPLAKGVKIKSYLGPCLSFISVCTTEFFGFEGFFLGSGFEDDDNRFHSKSPINLILIGR